ncbi:homeobox protein BEL1 homolog [Telopea speciosissima]|uniref:homeobox protein BEL1 homolog n=1 Tax=Telopea speciosissima TaxID=54955 RepID=UPI001CC5792E|nr:homeobox protein BEL1 homolog [Telopea speciosissima]
MVDDSSLRCVFPCEGNERPSQGLSLSLSSNKPSSIGLQSFELREMTNHHHFFGKSAILQEQQQQVPQDVFLGKAVANLHQTQKHFELKSSKYFVPAQELLNEFCNLEIKQTDPSKQEPQKTNQWEEGSSSCKQSLYAPELLELQKRKVKLISMLEEVDRRYRQYCDRMKAVAASFEAVAGAGAAKVYSASVSKAMSRHFRCLRDGIVGQIKATKKTIGEKDPVKPETTRGETPRVRLLDQTLRQQKPFQQMSLMESHPWRPQRGLPERSISVLRAWLFEHFLHPYPSDVDKHILSSQTGLSRSQVSNWFINARVRLWKPMVEEMYLEETKEEQQDNVGSSSDGITGFDKKNSCGPSHSQNSHSCSEEDMKPTLDSFSSSIVNNPDKGEESRMKGTAFGGVDLDFSSYNHHMTMAMDSNGVSLTLGLQQLEYCQSVHYSILDGEEQNLPYRNLMGSQLLHDLAG